MRRLIVVICAVALLSAACGEQQLGRRVVECEGPSRSLETSFILTAQAVPGADFIPCVEALRPGWKFEHIQARSGQAFFTLDSDRMGDDFLRVTLLPSCDVGAAREVDSDEPDTTLSIEVFEDRSDFVVVVIPVADRHLTDAEWVAAFFASGINGMYPESVEELTDYFSEPPRWHVLEGGGGTVEPLVVSIAGSQCDRFDAWDSVRDAILRTTDHAESLGVALCVEPHVGHMCLTWESTVKLVREVGSSNLRVSLDISQFLVLGLDHATALDRLSARVAHVHLQDFALRRPPLADLSEPRGNATAVPLGEGDRLFEDFSDFL